MSGPRQYIDIVRDHWGENAPAWSTALAAACDSSSQAEVARRIGYSSAAVSQVLRKRYNGGLSRFQTAVENHLMAAMVTCPYFGELRRTECDGHRTTPINGTNSTAATMRRLCRRCNNNPDHKVEGLS